MQRRTFVKTTAGALAAPGASFAAAGRVLGANDTVRVAVLGLHGRGQDHIKGFQPQDKVEVATLCDPDLNVARQVAGEFEKTYGRKVRIEQDLRQVFDDPEIDCVSIATPNHWHALAAIWACQAGKDVYVEKPGAHNVFEGRQLIATAQRYNRIVQHGVQLRSSPAVQEAVQLLRDGVIGKVYMGRALIYRWRPTIGHKQPEPVPPGIDWNLWQGPAQQRPFSRRYVHYNWHWHWDYGNGDMGNQGVHETDMLLWGLGAGLPSEVTAMGGKFLWDDDKETPEVLTALARWPEQNLMGEIAVRHWSTNHEDGVRVGNIFYGSKGFLLIKGYDTYEVYFGEEREPGPKRTEPGDHYANFIQAVRSRKTTDQNGPVETAHTSSALAHLANTSFRLGRQLRFDPAAEHFVGDEEANRYLKRDYRAPFVVPDKV